MLIESLQVDWHWLALDLLHDGREVGNVTCPKDIPLVRTLIRSSLLHSTPGQVSTRATWSRLTRKKKQKTSQVVKEVHTYPFYLFGSKGIVFRPCTALSDIRFFLLPPPPPPDIPRPTKVLIIFLLVRREVL